MKSWVRLQWLWVLKQKQNKKSPLNFAGLINSKKVENLFPINFMAR